MALHCVEDRCSFPEPGARKAVISGMQCPSAHHHRTSMQFQIEAEAKDPARARLRAEAATR
eukprot:7236652-Alexandrium_andersonii.AAC.1